ncbi:hypothetical protein AB4259_06595 [Vibrio amylolyticus]|uniref:hypothetical protein n=1 Tax=Vibrio amylolyticus TaxID=2847292 RepID=UPI0035541CF0
MNYRCKEACCWTTRKYQDLYNGHGSIMPFCAVLIVTLLAIAFIPEIRLLLP